MPSNTLNLWENRATKLTLTGVFVDAMAAFSTRAVGRGQDRDLRPFDLLLLGLSSYRTGRMIAYERIAEPIREPFTKTQPDESGAGDTVVAEGKGVRFALGELFSCPICLATWVSALLVYGLHLAPPQTRVYLAITSATGLAELLYEASEALAWTGQAERRRVGS